MWQRRRRQRIEVNNFIHICICNMHMRSDAYRVSRKRTLPLMLWLLFVIAIGFHQKYRMLSDVFNERKPRRRFLISNGLWIFSPLTNPWIRYQFRRPFGCIKSEPHKVALCSRVFFFCRLSFAVQISIRFRAKRKQMKKKNLTKQLVVNAGRWLHQTHFPDVTSIPFNS